MTDMTINEAIERLNRYIRAMAAVPVTNAMGLAMKSLRIVRDAQSQTPFAVTDEMVQAARTIANETPVNEMIDTRAVIQAAMNIHIANEGIRKEWADADKLSPAETLAKAIYDIMPMTEPCNKPAWVPNGNSFKQDEARKAARDVINTFNPLIPPVISDMGKLDDYINDLIDKRLKALGIKGEPIPEGIIYDTVNEEFRTRMNGNGMGLHFHTKWMHRRREFPTK